MTFSSIVRPAVPLLDIAGGDNVYELPVDGFVYRVHVFENSNPLTVSSEGWVEYLMCAGGGGGGGTTYRGGAGGGAGGLLEGRYYVTPETSNIIVGSGGQGGVGSSDGTDGANTEALGLIAVGGGGGARGTNQARQGRAGGSGGGSFQRSAGYGVIGQGTDGGYTHATSHTGILPFGAHGGSANFPYYNQDLPRRYNTGTENLGDGTVGRMSRITGLPIEYSKGGSSGTLNSTAYSATALQPGEGGQGAHGFDQGSRTAYAGADGIFIIRYTVRYT